MTSIELYMDDSNRAFSRCVELLIKAGGFYRNTYTIPGSFIDTPGQRRQLRVRCVVASVPMHLHNRILSTSCAMCRACRLTACLIVG